jgi:hypothetical protein
MEVHTLKILSIYMKILHHTITFILFESFSVGWSQECGTCNDINSCFKYRDKCLMSTYWKFCNTQHQCKGKAY